MGSRLRNLSDKCKKCGWNDHTLAWCFGTCDVPSDILWRLERKRYRQDKYLTVEDLPDIPPRVRDKHYFTSCPCGGTIDAYRLKESGKYHAKCDSCDFLYVK